MADVTFGSFFSGCGGLDVGLESLGWRCAWQIENDKDCARVLEARFPGVPNHGDVTEIDFAALATVDIVAGGFPCQDLSHAGRGAGLEGDRSGLYYFMADAIRVLRPRLVLIENVPGLLGRGLHVVVHDLATAGYEGTWRTLAAADLGAPHRRERVFVLARLAADESGVAGGQPLADYVPDGWEPPQASLLGRELLDKMPKAGAWTLGHAYEFDLPDRDDEVLLLPTPASSESTPTDEFVEEMRGAGIQPDARLYLPGRKWFTQRTLSRVVPTLLPTPGANDSTGAEGESRDARREDGTTGGPSLRDLPHLLQTPTSRDHKGRNQRGDDSCLPGAVDKLLPTPTAGDGKSAGSRNLEGSKAHDGVSLTDAVQYGNSSTPRLLPTPVANPENPGAGGELRAAIHHGPERRTDSHVDTMGRPIRKGREAGPLLPTPRVEASRSSRKSLVENKQWSAPSLEQAVEIAQGILPREFDSWDQVKGKDHPSEGAAEVAWGDYEPAIRRWEAILGRPAPLPTDEKGRLAPAFVSWMLGFPDGWVDLPSLKRTAQLRMLGNSVQCQVAQVVGLWLTELGGLA